MRRKPLPILLLGIMLSGSAQAVTPINFTKLWTYASPAAGFTSEIPAFDSATGTLWIAGVSGVDVLSLGGGLVQHIDTTAFGNINSVAVRNGIAAMAFENAGDRTLPGQVMLYDTSARALTSGINQITVGALPDMLTFTPDGSKLLVANEATPTVYGAQIGSGLPRNFSAALNDPAGSVSIIDMTSRSVVATPNFNGINQVGSYIRSNTGMDFEPEYIAVNAAGTKAFVGLQEANAMAVLNLAGNSFEKVVGLGAKDFSLPGNTIDPKDNDGTIAFANHPVKGLYMPDGMASYDVGGTTYVIMANEGDFREDDGDRSAASSFLAAAPLDRLRVSNTDSSPGSLFAAGARSFSIRDGDGNLVYDSGDILDVQASLKGIYNDGRSRDKGVEPEGIALLDFDGRTLAFVGLERTIESAIGIFDITDPFDVRYLDMIVGGDGDGVVESGEDVSPEGLVAFKYGGHAYLAIAHEVSDTTTLYNLTPVPEPESYAMLLAGLGVVSFLARRRGRMGKRQ